MAEVFDGIARDYDTWYTMELGKLVDKIETEMVMDLIKCSAGMKVLDIGCGTGNYSIKLAQLGCEVTAIDISGEMLKLAKEKAVAAGLKINFFQDDVNKVKFSPESFDRVVSVTALEFFPSPGLVLSRAFDWLKQNGRMVVGVIGDSSPWSDLYREKASQDKASVFNHAKFYTAGELLGLLPRGQRDVRTALYFPPAFDDFDAKTALAMEAAGYASNCPQGAGFVCGVWIKDE